MSRLDRHSEPRPHAPLARVDGQVCSLETCQTWLAWLLSPLLAKPISCCQVQEALFAAFWGPHGLVPSKAPAKLPARGLAGIVRSIYGTMPKPGRTSNDHW